MSEKNEFERRTDSMLSRWAEGKHTAFRLLVAGAFLVLLGFFVGEFVCRP